MPAATSFRNYVFLGITQSLCPECLAVVPAKIVAREGRIYFRKTCPRHGVREDFICSDAGQYDRMEFNVPGRVPREFGVDADRGCPFDCGLCPDHEQHTCIGLVEITESCNLKCPMCYASSGPGGKHLTLDECRRAIDRLVQVEGRPEVLQLSGGEPTIHPEFTRVFDYACAQPIDIVMINTNGLRLAHDAGLVKHLARNRHRCEVYLQFDGFRQTTNLALRGESVIDAKLRAIERLGEANLRTILVTTLQAGVNDDEIGAIVRFGLERPWITGVSFQPATYSGRHVLPEVLERRTTFPDVIRDIAEQTDGLFREDDFLPLPCAHPNCHQLSYAYRSSGTVIPITRFIDAKSNLDLLANGITFTRPRARQLIERLLGRLGSCGSTGGCDTGSDVAGSLPVRATFGGNDPVQAAAREFFARGIEESLAPSDVFRITITSFLDAYNFDVRRLMKCCIHHVLPSGHVIPFCTYNVLYRNGALPLPPLVAR
jgi:hypothetical protein